MWIDFANNSGPLVLGLGNYLLRDEGVGIHALQALQALPWPESVTLLDGGTVGMELYTAVTAAQTLIVLDAVVTGAEPGTLVHLAGEEVPARFGLKVSLHQSNLADVLAAVRLAGRMPLHLHLLGIVPENLRLGVELSPVVAARLPELVALARQMALQYGAGVHPA